MRAAPAERSFAIVAYNVENLHDLDGVAMYEDYQPAQYTAAHLAVKAANIAKVLARVDKGAGPALVAFNEIELDQTPESSVTDLDAWLASVAGRTLPELLGQNPCPPNSPDCPPKPGCSKPAPTPA